MGNIIFSFFHSKFKSKCLVLNHSFSYSNIIHFKYFNHDENNILIQTFIACAFFVVRCIGEWINVSVLKEVVSGVLELVTGFVSLYIFFYQIINETFRFQVFPALPLQKDNEIDICKEINHSN
jgi:succinate-acetate transporter protein